MAVKMLFMQVR